MVRAAGWVRAAGVVAGVFLLMTGAAETAHLKDNPKKHKIVYHFNGSDDGKHVQKAKEVLGNIMNHVTGVGGWKNIEDLVLVTHGNGIEPFVEKTMDPEVKKRFEMLMTSGMKMGV